MEIIQENYNQYVLSIPIAFIVLIVVGAILVFTFGFKSAEQPPFDKLTNEDRKFTGKKRKLKEKKTTSSGDTKNERESKKSSLKDPFELKVENKERKIDNKQLEKNKKYEFKLKSIDDIKNKRNTKKHSEKPLDFDEGNWETVLTKSDKKKKVDHSPDKKEKKVKKTGKEEIEKNENITNVESEEIDIKIDQPLTKVKIVDVEINMIEEKSDSEIEKKNKKEICEQISEQPSKNQILVNCQVETITDTCPVEDTSKSNETVAVFDELGDVWTEPRITKKTNKKKARRDN